MKLVDILARELKVWPESWGIYCVASKVNGSNAAWFNYRNPIFKDGGLEDVGSVELWLSQEPEDRKEVVVRRFEWQDAVDALKAESAPAWVGIGRPSVGTVCEFLDLRGGVKRDWVKVCVRYISDVMLVVKPDHPIDCQYEIALHPDTAQFRLLRTPEQIAAEDCDKAVKAMLAEFEHTGSLTSHYEVCEVLHKAGYRKFEIIDEPKS